MLEKMIREIRMGGTLTPALLAKRLDTSVEMVLMMLEQSVQMGLIDDFNRSCEQPCSGCSMGETCLPAAGQKARLWKSG